MWRVEAPANQAEAERAFHAEDQGKGKGSMEVCDFCRIKRAQKRARIIGEKVHIIKDGDGFSAYSVKIGEKLKTQKCMRGMPAIQWVCWVFEIPKECKCKEEM